MAYCSACQIEVPSGKFCTTCGRQLVVSPTAVPEPALTPVPVTGSNNLAMWAHLAPLLAAVVGLGIGVTLVLLWLPGLLIRNNVRSTDFDRRHATESLNFQISLLIYVVSGVILSTATFGLALIIAAHHLLLIGLAIAALIFNILAITAASNGREYRYPMTIRFVK